jgi:hypothetical protein
MGDEQEMYGNEQQSERAMIVTVEMSSADVERLVQAFRNGTLKHLGIRHISFSDKHATSSQAEEWQQTELKRRQERSDEESPKL